MKEKRFIPYEKLSRKERRLIDQARRRSWGEISPVTRKPESSRAYNRSDERRRWRKEHRQDAAAVLLCLGHECAIMAQNRAAGAPLPGLPGP